MRGRPGRLRSYRALLGYARRQGAWLGVIVTATFLSSALAVFQPWPLKLLVDGVLEGPQVLPSWLRWSAAPNLSLVIAVAAGTSLVLFLVVSAVDCLLSYAWVRAGQAMVYELATDLLRRYLGRSLAVHTKQSVGDALERIGTDSYGVYAAVESLLITPAQQILTLITVGLVAWRLDPGLTVLMFAVAPLLALSSLAMGPRLKRRSTAQREAQSRLSSFVHQTLSALPMVQSFATGPRNTERFGELAEAVVGHSRRGSLERGGVDLVNGLLVSLGSALVLWQAGLRVQAHGLSVGSLLVYLAYLGMVRGAYHNLFATWTKLKTIEASLDRVAEILALDDAIREPAQPRRLPPQGRERGASVVFDRVSFGYEATRPALRDIELAIAPGETLAIVGATGAGKSTLVAMVPRLFDPWSGRVAIDGVDVRELGLRDLRQRMSVVLQEPYLLPTSVADNIAFGRRDSSRAEIEAAAELARADDFIRALPEAYETILGERGLTLSGGQRQRLGIARALLRRPGLLILDEPTSALDAETEALLFDGLARLGRETTVLLVAHRLATVRRAQRIAVLERGACVEVGSHDQLLRLGGVYAQLWRTAMVGKAATS